MGLQEEGSVGTHKLTMVTGDGSERWEIFGCCKLPHNLSLSESWRNFICAFINNVSSDVFHKKAVLCGNR